mmetsp:Transcript_13349/g.27249  ORF Transcript_13349/g.27249 Transcript_13349/m.27249 type:complete len:188 (-) Transcript_13349:93-656(-)
MAEMGQPKEEIVVLPTYIMSPDETEKFYPSEVKKIATSILAAELDFMTTKLEEVEKDVVDEDATENKVGKYGTKEAKEPKGGWKMKKVKVMVPVGKGLVDDWMDGESEFFDNLSSSISDKIRSEVKGSLNVMRYKIVVQVTIGQLKDQAVRITSRCLWDTQTDNYASVDYKNEFVWASAIVFGLYAE